MYLIPFVHRSSTLAGKTVHTVRILLEGDRLWHEEAMEAALEENGLVLKALESFPILTLEGKSCVLAAIDIEKTDLSSMYSAEELDSADRETHRWCTFHLVFQNGALWLPPPADLVFSPLSPPASQTLLQHILKACDVDYINGGRRSS
jgi:hypothetical protein